MKGTCYKAYQQLSQHKNMLPLALTSYNKLATPDAV